MYILHSFLVHICTCMGTKTCINTYRQILIHIRAHACTHTRAHIHNVIHSYNIIRFCYHVSFSFQMEYHIYVYQFILHSTYIITAPTLTKVHTHMYIYHLDANFCGVQMFMDFVVSSFLQKLLNLRSYIAK